MSNLEILLDLIERNLETHKNHPFNTHPKYYEDFLCILNEYPCEFLYSTSGKRNALLSKLQLSKNAAFNPVTYCQGISEIVLYFNAMQKNLNFTPEKKLTAGGTDVDMQIQTKNATYNIEIKSPDINIPSASSGLVIENLFRTTENDWTKGIDQIDNIKLKKNDDNKVCSFLKSAQSKFCESSNGICNILFISLPLCEIPRYFGYITNGYSGIFSLNAPIRFLSADCFDKTDIIILSSIADGHTFSYEDVDSPWKLDEFFTHFISNPFKSIDANIAHELLEIIPNSTLEFDEFFFKFESTLQEQGEKINDKNNANDVMPLVFPEYFSRFYPKFYNQHTDL